MYAPLILTFFFGLIWSSLFEVPVGKIESILLRPKKREVRIKEERTEKQATSSWEADHTEN